MIVRAGFDRAVVCAETQNHTGLIGLDYKNAGKQPDDKSQSHYQFNRRQANSAQSIQAFAGLCWTLRRVIVVFLRLVAASWLPLPSFL